MENMVGWGHVVNLVWRRPRVGLALADRLTDDCFCSERSISRGKKVIFILPQAGAVL